MELVIVTGMSGAGKSRAVEAMEDIGFYCVDNMPPKLIPTFVQLCLDSHEHRDRVALVADIRLGGEFDELFNILNDLKSQNVDIKVLFIDADNEVIMRRYQETRRKHPLSDEFSSPSIIDAITKEREVLLTARQNADYIIDTSDVMNSQFKEKIVNLFLKNVSSSLKIYSISFGFKYGIPKEADLVFDVRCLPNPFYVPELKDHTGLEDEVKHFVMKFDQAQQLERKLYDLVDFLIPLYMKEGKSQLTIAVGCTGGKHRSVVFAELMNKHLLEKGSDVTVFHRDITR
jgi:UPF0042 nucleotide-binding protein